MQILRQVLHIWTRIFKIRRIRNTDNITSAIIDIGTWIVHIQEREC